MSKKTCRIRHYRPKVSPFFSFYSPDSISYNGIGKFKGTFSEVDFPPSRTLLLLPRCFYHRVEKQTWRHQSSWLVTSLVSRDFGPSVTKKKKKEGGTEGVRHRFDENLVHVSTDGTRLSSPYPSTMILFSTLTGFIWC